MSRKYKTIEEILDDLMDNHISREMAIEMIENMQDIEEVDKMKYDKNGRFCSKCKYVSYGSQVSCYAISPYSGKKVSYSVNASGKCPFYEETNK